MTKYVTGGVRGGLGRAAKIAGDKRALVAEKGFGRPFARVVISKSGSVAPPAGLQA